MGVLLFLHQIQLENANKDKQVKILTDQNAELLRLLETEEAQTSKLGAENELFRKVWLGTIWAFAVVNGGLIVHVCLMIHGDLGVGCSKV